MPTPKAAIKEVLESLDHKNDALWTDDGSPLVSEIQRLANDKTITRAQINEALPGFARKTSDSVTEDVQPDDEVEAEAQPIIEPTSEVQADEDDGFGLSEEQDHERLRQIAFSRVQEAEKAISDAKNAVADAHANVVRAEQRHTRALAVYTSKYPPLSVAENIQRHIQSQQEILRERVTGSKFEQNRALNPVDATLMDRKRNSKGQAPTFLPRSLAVGR